MLQRLGSASESSGVEKKTGSVFGGSGSGGIIVVDDSKHDLYLEKQDSIEGSNRFPTQK